MKKLIISAPFGNHLSHPEATSTSGTYTLQRRAGRLKRFWRVLTTVRYYPRLQSWVNKLGLPSPGIAASKDDTGKIVSIHGFHDEEWHMLAGLASLCDPEAIELNLSCPNVDNKYSTFQAVNAVEMAMKAAPSRKFIAKLAPYKWMSLGVPLYDVGIRCFHLCNSMQTPGGGMSGKVLKPYSLWAVEQYRARFADRIEIIGGGGVTGPEDARDYLRAGADMVAVGSTCFNPFGRRRRLDAIALAINEWGMP